MATGTFSDGGGEVTQTIEYGNSSTTYGMKMDNNVKSVTPTNHNDLLNRDAENAHTISAITGLESALEEIDTALNGKVNTDDLKFNDEGGVEAATADKLKTARNINCIPFDGSEDITIQAPVFVKGTQTASTNAWTGDAPTIKKLYDGLTIMYLLPFKGNSSATLELTLADGSTTGPVNCYYRQNTRLTTHVGAGHIFSLTYLENVAYGSATYTGWYMEYGYNSDTYNRTLHSVYTKAGAAITAASLVVGIEGLYYPLNSGDTFDITYPILYCAQTMAANAATDSGFYDDISFGVTTTQTITLTPYMPVYIKGTLEGTMFTPISATPLTQERPTEDDGYAYIMLGSAGSATQLWLQKPNDIFAFRDGTWRKILS